MMKLLTPHPLFPALVSALSRGKRPFHSWAGTVFRSVELEFARSGKLLDGKGSLKHGSRWAAPGLFRSVSLCMDPQVADREATQRGVYYGWSRDMLRPRVRVAVTVKLRNLMKLAGKARAGPAGVMLPELLIEDWRKINDGGKESLSQALGRVAHEAGAEALLVPSAIAAGAFNLVIFVENLLPESAIVIENQTELDRWLKKK